MFKKLTQTYSKKFIYTKKKDMKEKKVFKTIKINEKSHEILKRLAEEENMKMANIIESLLTEKIEIRNHVINKRN